MPGKTLYSLPTLQSALRVKVKLALNCGRKVSPTIKISMLFEFNGGLKAVNVLSKTLHEDQPLPGSEPFTWQLLAFQGTECEWGLWLCPAGHCRLQPLKG